MGLEELGFVTDARSRSYERHVAAKDIEQLRQLVETRLPENGSHSCDFAVASELVVPVCHRCGLAVHDVADVLAMLFLIGPNTHRSELQGGEFPHFEPESPLTEQDRAVRIESYGHCDREEQGQRQEKKGASDRDVQPSLDQSP